MARHGSIDKVGVRAVAAEVGVSPTAVYRHFDNHTDLIQAAVEHCFDAFRQRLVDARASADEPYGRLVASRDAYVAFATEEPGKYRVMFSTAATLPEAARPVPGLDTFGILVELVADVLHERGDDRDPHYVAVQVWTWIHGIVDLAGTGTLSELWPDMDQLMAGLSSELGLDRPS